MTIREITKTELTDLENIAIDLDFTEEDVSNIIELVEKNPKGDFEYKGMLFVHDESDIDTNNMSWVSVDSQFGDWVIFDR